jgi:hypothetical protein
MRSSYIRFTNAPLNLVVTHIQQFLTLNLLDLDWSQKYQRNQPGYLVIIVIVIITNVDIINLLLTCRYFLSLSLIIITPPELYWASLILNYVFMCPQNFQNPSFSSHSDTAEILLSLDSDHSFKLLRAQLEFHYLIPLNSTRFLSS